MKNILVAVDFKEGTEKVLDFAKQFGQFYLAKVWIIHVSAPEPDFVGYEVGPQYISDMREIELKEEHKQLKKYADDLSFTGVAAESIMLEGGTVEMLSAEIEKLHVKLLIVGHHKHGFFHKAFFGRTDVSLIEHVNIPTLVVPVD
ncbi:universal stress protein [Plebeiibacterium sediminum]|uniref:Universal stress protein n=1 Tax=Plebeiibacterium sediminum TaxID=2992112 RepID=A0AAE3SF77_9BACT|nr:universal stress protein [Plebeiobacterium sediminum]MCW3787200.1 universal stress protein [Plebeiobacterium sediminum]